METEAAALAGIMVFRASVFHDERGSFERVWSAAETARAVPGFSISQISYARTRLAGTLRGLHYAVAPDAEAKFLRCLRGACFDVAVDLRPLSPTRGRVHQLRLRAEDGVTLYLPPGFAHGYQALEDDCEMVYCIDRPYIAASARVLSYCDPHVGIRWPLDVVDLSERDRAGLTLAEACATLEASSSSASNNALFHTSPGTDAGA